MIPTIAIVLVTVFTLSVGSIGVRYARTTSNFFVASRAVHPAWNAFAICGEYLSAGSYLGLAGLVLVFGIDIVWFTIGWTAGYLLLLSFVAAPLRRFGSYTIPEFAEGRLDAPAMRPLSASFVIVISVMYLLPQMKAAGLIVETLIGAPYWVGVAAAGLVIALNLVSGGMRSITFVQGFQFFLVALGVLLPAVVLGGAWLDDGRALAPDGPAVFSESTAVTYDAATAIVVTSPVTALESVSGDDRATERTFAAGPHEIAAGTTIEWPAGAAVPHRDDIEPVDGETWLRPFGDKNLAGGHPMYFAYSVLLATVLGTMGLPHILVRFYTNPTGFDARRTTVFVVALLGPYYAVLPLFGALGRAYSPDLLSTGETDAVAIVVSERLVGGIGGELLTGVIAAGAVAALLSTASGLLIAAAGAISHDLAGGGVRLFRRAVWLAATVTVALGLLARRFDVSILVGWAFAVAASSFCPLLVLGIWWRGLTRRGAMASMLVGGGAATTAIVATMAGVVEDGWPFALCSTPGAWSVPLAFATAIVVSRRDSDRVAGVDQKFALLHVPERQGA